MSLIHPVVLCGGSGTRLWPRSRVAKPKPFLPLLGERTLFQATLDRVANREIFAEPIVVAGARHLEHILDQAGGEVQVIVEPAAKNTAPAIALAAHRLPADAVMLVCPSDHHIADAVAFNQAAQAAAALARDGRMVAFGIAAQSPETGYGYIKRGQALDGSYTVERFVEKPDRATAEAFLADGGYSWNGGIFAFGAGAFLRELATHRPGMAAALEQAVAEGEADGAQFRPDAAIFSTIEGESVDFAVMENTARAAMVPVQMGWSDIGGWPALHIARERDEAGNCVRGNVDLVDCSNVMVESDGPRVSVIGLANVVVVVDGDEVLVTTSKGAQGVGRLPGAGSQ